MGTRSWISPSFFLIRILLGEEVREDRMDPMRKRLDRVSLGPGVEFDLIRQLVGPEEPLSQGVLLGSGDDCTVLEGGVVVSTDLSVEGVHFRREWVTLEEAGYRAAAAALSDLAAMAAEPLGALISMALDPSEASNDAAQLQRGAAEACHREGIQILGGDLARSPGPLVLNIVALGRSDSPILRAGTEVGDDVWVTGWLGGSGAAVALWNQGYSPPDDLRDAFVRPRPRIREALWLAARVPLHGLIDLSDGLAGDSGHLAAASGLSLVLREAWIPSHPAIDGLSGQGGNPLHFPLQGGEDYELCFTVPPETLDEWVGPFQDSFGVPLTKVGWATEGKGILLEADGGEVRPLEEFGFSHFSGEEEG
jgi:thiamine-monophosphate kinase